MSSDVRPAGADVDAGEAFLAAAQRWLQAVGREHAARHVHQLALEPAATADDLCNDAFVSLLVTVGHHGAPVDPSDGDAVAAYVYKTLEHRALDQARAVRRLPREQPWPDDGVAPPQLEEEEVVAPLLTQMLFDCVRRMLQTSTPLRDVLVVPVALAALTYLQIGTPPDAPRPRTKGTVWTRAGWAALHSVDPEHFFPDEDAVLANTATQRRRATLSRARRLIQVAAVECGAQP